MWSHLYRLLFYWHWRELGFTKTPTTDWLLWTLCTGQSFYCTGHRHSPCQHGNRCCASNHGVRFPWCGNDRRSGSIGIHAIFPAMKKTVFVEDGHICVLWLLPIRHSNECIMMTSLDKFMLHYGSIFCSWRHNYQRVTSSKKIYIINWSVFCNHQSYIVVVT